VVTPLFEGAFDALRAGFLLGLLMVMLQGALGHSLGALPH
jgi:hypothetical protein